MKKLIFTFASILCLLTSCSSNDKIEEADLNLKIDRVLKEKNNDAQRIMYNLLSADEKYMLWMDKIDKIIKEDNLNIAQLNLIYEL